MSAFVKRKINGHQSYATGSGGTKMVSISHCGAQVVYTFGYTRRYANATEYTCTQQVDLLSQRGLAMLRVCQ